MSKMHICTCPSKSLNTAWYLRCELAKITPAESRQNGCLNFPVNCQKSAHCRAFLLWCEAGGKLWGRIPKGFVIFLLGCFVLWVVYLPKQKQQLLIPDSCALLKLMQCFSSDWSQEDSCSPQRLKPALCRRLLGGLIIH